MQNKCLIMSNNYVYLIGLIITYLFGSCVDSNEEKQLNNKLSLIESKNISGYRLVINEKTNVSFEGAYSNGFKIGNWNYDINQEKFNLVWEKLELGEGLVINKPNKWEEVEIGIEGFSVKGTVKEDTSQVVIIQKQDLNSNKDYLETYKTNFFIELYSMYEVIDTSSKCFNNGEDEFLPLTNARIFRVFS